MISRKNRCFSECSGVTLVEMSVVIVIIGIIIVMVMKGQDILHKSRLDSAVADLQKYKTIAQQFRTKYYYFPGDIPNPTQYMSGTTCADVAGNTCKGNGDRQILRDGSTREESLRAWQHLALTEMIPGTYTGRRTGTSTSAVVQGRLDGTDNIPSSKLEYELGGMGGYWFYYGSPATGYTGNYLLLGRDPSSVLTDNALNGIISPKNANAIDRKIDDGVGVTGLLIGVNSAAAPNACITSGDYTTGTTADTQSCVLWFSID